MIPIFFWVLPKKRVAKSGFPSSRPRPKSQYSDFVQCVTVREQSFHAGTPTCPQRCPAARAAGRRGEGRQERHIHRGVDVLASSGFRSGETLGGRGLLRIRHGNAKGPRKTENPGALSIDFAIPLCVQYLLRADLAHGLDLVGDLASDLAGRRRGHVARGQRARRTSRAGLITPGAMGRPTSPACHRPAIH